MLTTDDLLLHFRPLLHAAAWPSDIGEVGRVRYGSLGDLVGLPTGVILLIH